MWKTELCLADVGARTVAFLKGAVLVQNHMCTFFFWPSCAVCLASPFWCSALVWKLVSSTEKHLFPIYESKCSGVFFISQIFNFFPCKFELVHWNFEILNPKLTLTDGTKICFSVEEICFDSFGDTSTHILCIRLCLHLYFLFSVFIFAFSHGIRPSHWASGTFILNMLFKKYSRLHNFYSLSCSCRQKSGMNKVPIYQFNFLLYFEIPFLFYCCSFLPVSHQLITQRMYA